MAKKIRSVLFLARLYSPHVGGVEKHLAKVCHYLHQKGIRTIIITEQYDSKLLLKEKIAGSVVLRIPYSATKAGFVGKLLLWSWIASRWRLFLRASVIHIHDVFWWILPFSPLLKGKTFMTFHGYEGAEPPTDRAKFWHQLAAKLTSRSLGIGDFHRKWYGVNPDITSFGAVEESLFKKEDKAKTKKAKSPITNIIFLGRLAKDTGILTYLQGFKLLVESAQANQKFMLDIFGDGPLMQKAQTYAKEHQLPVTFHGFVEGAADKLPEYQVAFISRHLAILEALAQRIPVVAHYNNQIKQDYLEISPFKNWISIVHTSQQVADAVANPTEISDEAYDWVSKQTWQKMVQNYLDLWAKT
jgi:glycosyltransferase involved in cell wall biosynthesis